jgi:ectoine hydroxylase-related dioxygenase (phytanoyl-CoA dioxygenase family)
MIMSEKEKNELETKGYTIIRNLVSEEWMVKLSDQIDLSFEKHSVIQMKHNNEIDTGGVALHVILNHNIFIEFLDHLLENGFVDFIETNYFRSKCILNSFSALNNLPNNPNFSSNVHRDLRFYSDQLPIMLNSLLMVDDFTIENGATYLLPYSHLFEHKPSNDVFHNESIQAEGKRGDMLVFNSNVWHSSAPNKTENQRRGIPITFSKSFMKQLLDYPRAVGYEKMDSFRYELQQILGYHSRVPSSLDEWYQPENKRFYKKNQD